MFRPLPDRTFRRIVPLFFVRRREGRETGMEFLTGIR